MSQPKKARPIWVIEYLADDGAWYHIGATFYNRAKDAKFRARFEKGQDPAGKYRAARYERTPR